MVPAAAPAHGHPGRKLALDDTSGCGFCGAVRSWAGPWRERRRGVAWHLMGHLEDYAGGSFDLGDLVFPRRPATVTAGLTLASGTIKLRGRLFPSRARKTLEVPVPTLPALAYQNGLLGADNGDI